MREFSLMPPPPPREFEDLARWEALKRFLDGDEEGALDLLAVAREMAGVAT